MKRLGAVALSLLLALGGLGTAACEKHEHTFGAWEEVTPPTCLEEGLKRQTCTVCGDKNEEAIGALGHDWDEGEVTREPTEEAEGELTKHCKRAGCTETDVSVIPKLEPAEELFYRFSVVRTDGSSLKVSGLLVLVTPKAGGKTVSTFLTGSQTGMYLKAGTYLVTAEHLPEGYSVQAEGYEVSADDPACQIVLTAALISEPATEQTVYDKGSVMHDFTVQTTRGEVRFGDLLKDKAVVLNFWYVNCGPCREEFPFLEAVYQRYKDFVEVLAIDKEEREGLAQIEQFMSGRNLTFLAGTDVGLGLFSKFRIGGVPVGSAPVTVAIDREGVVIEAWEGSASQEEFEALFARLADGVKA